MDVFDLIAGAAAGTPGKAGTIATLIFVIVCGLVVGTLLLL